MARTFYTESFKSQLVALVQQGRSPESLSREYEPTAQSIRAWVDAARLVGLGGGPIDKDDRIRKLEREHLERAGRR